MALPMAAFTLLSIRATQASTLSMTEAKSVGLIAQESYTQHAMSILVGTHTPAYFANGQGSIYVMRFRMCCRVSVLEVAGAMAKPYVDTSFWRVASCTIESTRKFTVRTSVRLEIHVDHYL